MKILTVRQPWAWAIIHAGKTVENRQSNIAGSYRGPVAIHAAKAYSDEWVSPELASFMNNHPGVWDEPQPWRDHFGHIIGVVDLTDVHRVVPGAARSHCETVREPQHESESGACSHWAELGALHLVLANPRPLSAPIAYRGMLGLRHLDDETTALLEAAIA